MEKNIKSINSKLTKLFLLSCANAAIMTAMVGEARADIEIYYILNHTADYQALTPAKKLNVIKGIQGHADFGDLFDGLMPEERRLFNNEIIEALAAGAAIVDLTAGRCNIALETGRNEQEMALENRPQVLEILAKAEGANAVSVNDKIKKAIHFNNIENLNTPLEQLKYIAMTGGVDVNDDLKVVNNYVDVPLTKEAFEHVFFGTNITDKNVLGADSLNNEIERIVNNFNTNTLKFSDALDLALNKGDVRDNIAIKANEVNIEVNTWINNNIVNLTVGSDIDSGDLTFLQNKAAPGNIIKNL